MLNSMVAISGGRAIPLDWKKLFQYSIITDVDETLLPGMHRDLPAERSDGYRNVGSLRTLSDLFNVIGGALLFCTNSDRRPFQTMVGVDTEYPIVSEQGRVVRIKPDQEPTFLTPRLIEVLQKSQEDIEQDIIRIISDLNAELGTSVRYTFDAAKLDGNTVKIEVKETAFFMGVGHHPDLINFTAKLAGRITEFYDFALGSMYAKEDGRDGTEIARIDASGRMYKKAQIIPYILDTEPFKGRVPIIIGDSGSDIEMMIEAAKYGDYVGIFVGDRKDTHPEGLLYVESINDVWLFFDRFVQQCANPRLLLSPPALTAR